MTGKRPPRYEIQRDYGAGFVTIREYTLLNPALVELHRLRTFRKHQPVRLFDKRKQQEIEP